MEKIDALDMWGGACCYNKKHSEWMPRLHEIEPNTPYELTFRLGHVIIAYEPNDWERRGLEQKPTKLESIVRVGKAVKVSEPDEEKNDELFTVWLSEYGTVSDLKLFSRRW